LLQVLDVLNDLFLLRCGTVAVFKHLVNIVNHFSFEINYDIQRDCLGLKGIFFSFCDLDNKGTVFS